MDARNSKRNGNGKPRAWCELLRLPNVFTAMTNVLAGYWLASADLVWSWRLGVLLFASCALYSSGILLNDLHDLEIDRRERPSGPLPSGRVDIGHARVVAIGLLVLGVIAGATAGTTGWTIGDLLSASNHAGLAVAALAACILAYDLLLKATPLGPIVLGACRGLTVLMAMVAVPGGTLDPQGVAVVAMFVFVASITFFGRREAECNSRGRLICGTIGILASLLILLFVVMWNHADDEMTLVFWLAVSFHFLRVAVRAIRRPDPATVQYTMRTFILGIAAMDAVAATAAAGWAAGAIVLALLVPATVLAKRFDCTWNRLAEPSKGAEQRP